MSRSTGRPGTGHLVALADCPALPWRNGGGITHDLLAWPPGDAPCPAWQLRVSVATIDRDGPFSRFDGMQRWFTVLSGAGVRLRLPGAEVRLLPGDPPLGFDGADAPGCTLLAGPTRDLNLMALHSAGRARMRCADAGQPLTGTHRWRGLYTAAPAVLLTTAGRCAMAAHSLAWTDATGTGDIGVASGARVPSVPGVPGVSGMPGTAGAWALVDASGPAWWLTLEA